MTKTDLPAVMAIEDRSFSHPWRVTAFQGEIENHPISTPLVITAAEGRVIGYVIYWLIDKEAQIANFAIHPDYRKRGIGRDVLQRVLDEIRAKQGEVVFLEVRPSNRSAIKVYKTRGFKVLGVRKNYYTRPEEDAVIMGRIL